MFLYPVSCLICRILQGRKKEKIDRQPAFSIHFFVFFTFLVKRRKKEPAFLSVLCIRYENCEEPMTEVTGFRQSVRLFQSCDPVTPSLLSSFLLHLSDALPSGRVLLRLSVSILTLTVLLRCRLFKWTLTTASTLPRGTVASLSGYFRFRSACLHVTGLTRCWVNSYF